MAKIQLGHRPKTFKPFPVRFDLPDGSEGVIEVTYKYRTKIEFGQMLDELLAKGKQAEAAADEAAAAPQAFSWQKFLSENVEAGADQLLAAIDSWNLDEPLTRETLIQLGNEIPSGMTALAANYANACREGRLGN